MVKLPYKEGTWFAVPLRDGGYAVGVVARHVPRIGRIILAYFFGPKRDAIPTLEELDHLRPTSAIKIAQVGDLGLIEGRWPIIGETESWLRQEWPIPQFIRKDELISKTAWLVTYDDDNPNEVISEERVPLDTPGYERDSLHGAGAAEIALTKLLT